MKQCCTIYEVAGRAEDGGVKAALHAVQIGEVDAGGGVVE
jgi:hypothetical protein